MPKSSHRKKEKPPRRKRRLPAELTLSKPGGGKDDLAYEVGEVTFSSNADVEQERKKPRLVALSFCDYISLDSLGKVNLMGCFDRIYADKKTGVTGNFYLYVRTAETRKGHVEVTFLDPQNKPVAQASYDVDTENAPLDRPIHAQFYGLIGFVAKSKGVYWVDVAYNGESLGGRDLTISERETKEDGNERNNV